MITRNLPGGKWRPAHKADDLTAISEPIIYKILEPRRLTTLWAFTACYRDSFIFTFYFTAEMCFLGRVSDYTLNTIIRNALLIYNLG
jgi:hypothetical protein